VDRQFSYSKIDYQLKLNEKRSLRNEPHNRQALTEAHASGNILTDFLYQLKKSSSENENRKKKANIPHIKRKKGLRR